MTALGVTAMMIANSAAATVKKIVNSVNQKTVSVSELTAAILISEAGGEGTSGIRAVMEVIRSRMKNKKQSMYRVVTQKCAFSCYNKWHNNPVGFINKNKKHPLFREAVWIVNNYHGNVTKNANFYHEKTKSPVWSSGVTPTVVIGNHKFFNLVGLY